MAQSKSSPRKKKETAAVEAEQPEVAVESADDQAVDLVVADDPEAVIEVEHVELPDAVVAPVEADPVVDAVVEVVEEQVPTTEVAEPTGDVEAVQPGDSPDPDQSLDPDADSVEDSDEEIETVLVSPNGPFHDGSMEAGLNWRTNERRRVTPEQYRQLRESGGPEWTVHQD